MSIVKFVFAPVLCCDSNVNLSEEINTHVMREDFMCCPEHTRQFLNVIIDWYQEQMSITGEYNGIKLLEIRRSSTEDTEPRIHNHHSIIEHINENCTLQILSGYPKLTVTIELETVDDNMNTSEIENEISSVIEMLIDPDPSRNYDIEFDHEVLYLIGTGYKVLELSIAQSQEEQ